MAQSESTFSEATFSPSDPSPWSLQGVAAEWHRNEQFPPHHHPVPSGDSFALGHQENLGFLEGAKGLK